MDYNDSRLLLNKMRRGGFRNEEKKPQTYDMRYLLGKMRNLNEDDEEKLNPKRKIRVNKATSYDQEIEESKINKYFDDLKVIIDFIPLEIYDDLVFWGGTVDGTIQFAYKVTPNEKTSGVEFNYLDDFQVDNEDNDEIVKRIEDYYDIFFKYWRDNILTK